MEKSVSKCSETECGILYKQDFFFVLQRVPKDQTSNEVKTYLFFRSLLLLVLLFDTVKSEVSSDTLGQKGILLGSSPSSWGDEGWKEEKDSDGIGWWSSKKNKKRHNKTRKQITNKHRMTLLMLNHKGIHWVHSKSSLTKFSDWLSLKGPNLKISRCRHNSLNSNLNQHIK